MHILPVSSGQCGVEVGGQCGVDREGSAGQAARWKLGHQRCPPGSPIIRQIRQACAEPFEAFEECLRQNEASAGKCAEQVRRFLQCAEQVPPQRPPAAIQVETRITHNPTCPHVHSLGFSPATCSSPQVPAWVQRLESA